MSSYSKEMDKETHSDCVRHGSNSNRATAARSMRSAVFENVQFTCLADVAFVLGSSHLTISMPVLDWYQSRQSLATRERYWKKLCDSNDLASDQYLALLFLDFIGC